ncbi:hypothetical protein V1264_013014 [Littorina saxatilis]|uniref:Uncharacterized protein n=1 Tax=Littorina saxatilis TaxID=31220 RepID=A0AAN9BXT5_9CAEN
MKYLKKPSNRNHLVKVEVDITLRTGSGQEICSLKSTENVLVVVVIIGYKEFVFLQKSSEFSTENSTRQQKWSDCCSHLQQTKSDFSRLFHYSSCFSAHLSSYWNGD